MKERRLQGFVLGLVGAVAVAAGIYLYRCNVASQYFMGAEPGMDVEFLLEPSFEGQFHFHLDWGAGVPLCIHPWRSSLASFSGDLSAPNVVMSACVFDYAGTNFFWVSWEPDHTEK